MSIEYLKGLNSLRFFAAFFVIISHGQISLWKLGIVSEQKNALFNRGADGVEFFFTLSGFLITCLLIKETGKTGTVSLRKFYLRRVFRIWPLYFLVVAIGFFLLGAIYPVIYGEKFFEFNLLNGVVLFIFFLPNLVTSFYPTGLLYPLWSIGVEEQYYLFWAPLIKIFKGRILAVIIIFVILSHLWFLFVYYDKLGLSQSWLKFLLSQKFYAMSMGGLFAYFYMNHRHSLQNSFFTGKYFQFIVFSVILYHYLIGFNFSWHLWFHFLLAVLYGFLILHTVMPNSMVNFEIQPFSYLGVISYGLYMYHMIVDYLLRFIFSKVAPLAEGFNLLTAVFYHVCLLGLTVLVASLSYKYFEAYFLKVKLKYS